MDATFILRCEFESSSSEVYSIQHYVITFVSDFTVSRYICQCTPSNKTGPHDITKILLKVALNTIIQPNG